MLVENYHQFPSSLNFGSSTQFFAPVRGQSKKGKKKRKKPGFFCVPKNFFAGGRGKKIEKAAASTRTDLRQLMAGTPVLIAAPRLVRRGSLFRPFPRAQNFSKNLKNFRKRLENRRFWDFFENLLARKIFSESRVLNLNRPAGTVNRDPLATCRPPSRPPSRLR